MEQPTDDGELDEAADLEAKTAWLKEAGMGDDEIAFMLAVESGEIDGDVIIDEEDV